MTRLYPQLARIQPTGDELDGSSAVIQLSDGGQVEVNVSVRDNEFSVIAWHLFMVG